MQRSLPRNVCAVLLVAAFSGCTVSPLRLADAEIEVKASSLAQRVDEGQEPITGSLDLYEAMARALKYNLDHRVEAMEIALKLKELDLSHFSLLPNFVANSGYAARNNFNASSSFNILSNTQNFGASTSQEKANSTRDVALTWNILDFGLSYVRARQTADKYLVAHEMRRKVVHRVIEDVRTAFWRSVSGEVLLDKLKLLEGRVKSAQESSRLIAEERSTSPITAVTYERELVEIKRVIHELERDLVVAKTQLAALMNTRPGTKFKLHIPKRNALALSLNYSVDQLVSLALHNRAELREVWYRQRINQRELDAALLELLPGFQLYAGSNYDSNEFLYNNNWVSWGSKASWNLLRVAQFPAKRDVVDAQEKLLDSRALAVTMAVMTQVHVSRVRFYHFQKEFKTATEYLEVQSRLLRLMRDEAAAGRIGEQTIIREEMNTVVAEAKRDIAHAAVQNAFANVYASIGLDPFAGEVGPDLSVAQLAQGLRALWFERGDLAAVPSGSRLVRR